MFGGLATRKALSTPVDVERPEEITLGRQAGLRGAEPLGGQVDDLIQDCPFRLRCAQKFLLTLPRDAVSF